MIASGTDRDRILRYLGEDGAKSREEIRAQIEMTKAQAEVTLTALVAQRFVQRFEAQAPGGLPYLAYAIRPRGWDALTGRLEDQQHAADHEQGDADRPVDHERDHDSDHDQDDA